MKRSAIHFILPFIFIVSAMAWQNTAGASSIYVVTDKSPYCYMVNGVPEGIWADLIGAVMREAGIKNYDIAIYPWSRAYNLALNNENTMILPLARTPEREGFFKWAGPIMPIEFYLIRLKDSDHIKLSSLESAKKYNIGVILEDVSHNYLLDKGFSLLSPAEPKLLIRMLNIKRVDMICITRNKLAYTTREQGIDPSGYTFEWHVKDLDLDLYAGFSKKTDDALVARVQKSLLQIKANGVYQRIMESIGFKPKHVDPPFDE